MSDIKGVVMPIGEIKQFPCETCGGARLHYANCPLATSDDEVYTLSSMRAERHGTDAIPDDIKQAARLTWIAIRKFPLESERTEEDDRAEWIIALALKTEREKHTLRPIEEAPRDGTHIIGWQAGGVYECWWGEGGWDEGGWGDRPQPTHFLTIPEKTA